MWLDLSKIIEIPGASKEFEVTLDPEHLLTPSIRNFKSPPAANGKVTNTAGLLSIRGTLRAEMTCVCDRCGTEFDRVKVMELDIPLAADMEDEADADVFPVEGDGIDVTEILETCFILDTDTKFLCREDCKGLCPDCGKNLNEGSCSCKKPLDPRMAVLGQLLDNENK